MIERLPNEILDAASKPEQVEYTIHYKAVLKAAKAYGDEPSTARKKIWEESKRSLSDQEAHLMEKYGKEQAAPDTFATQQDVLVYLKAGGYKIEKSALSNHVRTRLLIKKQGVFRRQDVDKYADLHLQSGATGQKAADKKLAGLQERKLKAETDRTEEQARKAKLEREAMEGKMLPRADVELELAARAVVIDSGISGLIQSHAATWIDLVAGDQAKLPDLTEAMANNFRTLLNEYATTDIIRVVLNRGGKSDD
jgi:phage terminase Nu1 subunit (DNA packaging protein)